MSCHEGPIFLLNDCRLVNATSAICCWKSWQMNSRKVSFLSLILSFFFISWNIGTGTLCTNIKWERLPEGFWDEKVWQEWGKHYIVSITFILYLLFGFVLKHWICFLEVNFRWEFTSAVLFQIRIQKYWFSLTRNDAPPLLLAFCRSAATRLIPSAGHYVFLILFKNFCLCIK